ncbi:MAG TPA: hypothetical protein VF904_10685 [Anaeromyxobacteraceae bacterium]
MDALEDCPATFERKRASSARIAFVVLTLAAAFASTFLGVLWHEQHVETPSAEIGP